jgi:hypothetical protein
VRRISAARGIIWQIGMPLPNDLTDKKYGRLTGIKFTGKYYITSGGRGNRKRIWLWRCDCGNEKEIIAEKVTSGQTKSCSCLRGPNTGEMAVAYAVFGDYMDGDLLFSQFLELSQMNCYYCNCSPSNHRKSRGKQKFIFSYNGLNRLDHSQPHNLDNVRPCCARCNYFISNRTELDFLELVELIYNNRIKND